MESTAKELIILWFKYHTFYDKEFKFGTHFVALELPEFGFRTIGKYYSPGTYDRKFRELKKEYEDKKTRKLSLLNKSGLDIKPDNKTEKNSREKHYIVRRTKIGEVH